MPRYIAEPVGRQPTADWSDPYPLIPDLSVEGPKRVDTGLVNDKGDPIYRLPPPIGFGRNDEW
jgi:hypothetical protein